LKDATRAVEAVRSVRGVGERWVAVAGTVAAQVVSSTVMRRIGVLVALGVVAAAVAIYLGTRGSTTSALAVTLTAQQSPALPGLKRDWTTTRRISVRCGTQPSVTGSISASGQALCNAVTYYSHHVPTKRCIVIGPILNHRRVLITGTLGGERVHVVMGVVCNPPPALSRAAQTIYVAAFT
jgi:hypothetical protein